MTSNLIYNEQIKQAIDKWGTSLFKFDELSGNVTDSKGSAIGTVTGTTRVEGWNGEGNALSFDGVNDFLRFNTRVIPYVEKSIRFKINVQPLDRNRVILSNSHYGSSGNNPVPNGFSISVSANNRLVVASYNSQYSPTNRLEGDIVIADRQWHDVLVSIGGAGNIKRVEAYVDGVKTIEGNIDEGSNNSPLFIGKLDVNNQEAFFLGQIDDLQIYNKALTPSDFYLNKTLILSQNEYKKWDTANGWTTVSSTLPSVTQFLSEGMDSLPTPLDGLNDDFEIITWTDETDSTRALEVNTIPSPQFIAKATLSDVEGNLNGILTEDLSIYSTSSNVRFLITNDNSTWYKWNGTDFEEVSYSNIDDILTLGNTYTELTNVDYSKWSHSKVNVGAFLMDDDNTTSKISELGFIANSPIHTSQVSDLNFYILNTTAKIELDLKGLWLSGQLSDLDLTRVQYRVFLNEQPYYPLSGQFTNLDNPPLNIDITFKSEEVKINDWNTLRVEFKDSFGTVDYWQTTFVGNYSSLMFTDTDGKYYSDDVGKVLQYLDFGTFFGGQYSVEHEVIIKNQYGYDVENVMIEASTGHLPEGVEVQFSDTKEPFIPQANLLLPNELKHEEEVSFYIRMISDIDSVPNGENKFNIFVKAERKV